MRRMFVRELAEWGLLFALFFGSFVFFEKTKSHTIVFEGLSTPSAISAVSAIVRKESTVMTHVLYDLPEHRIAAGGIELYQNTGPNPTLPFEFRVDVEAWKRFASAFEREKATVSGHVTRFVIDWPDEVNDAALERQDSICTSVVLLELGAEVCRRVYFGSTRIDDLNGRDRGLFVRLAQERMNLVLFHEAEHIRHCRDGVAKQIAEREARTVVKRRLKEIGPVLYVQLKPGFDIATHLARICDERR